MLVEGIVLAVAGSLSGAGRDVLRRAWAGISAISGDYD